MKSTTFSNRNSHLLKLLFARPIFAPPFNCNDNHSHINMSLLITCFEPAYVSAFRHHAVHARVSVSSPSRLADNWLTGKLQSAFDADDVTQDTFLRVMGSESLTAIRDPRSFLCTIARRVMIDLFRRNALERAWLEMLAQLPQTPSFAGATAHPAGDAAAGRCHA